MRDLLEAPDVVPDTSKDLIDLMHEQNNYLQDISIYLRRQNADVLCSAVVRGASQLTNSITDGNSHEVWFEVGGKPVEIFHLIAFSTFGSTIGLSVVSLANVQGGIPLAAGDVYDLSVPTHTVHVMAPSATSGAPLVVNGSTANADTGGLYLYGYTIPDWDRIRNDFRR